MWTTGTFKHCTKTAQWTSKTDSQHQTQISLFGWFTNSLWWVFGRILASMDGEIRADNHLPSLMLNWQNFWHWYQILFTVTRNLAFNNQRKITKCRAIKITSCHGKKWQLGNESYGVMNQVMTAYPKLVTALTVVWMCRHVERTIPVVEKD